MRFALPVLLSLLALSACGGGSADHAAAPETKTADAAPAATPEPAPPPVAEATYPLCTGQTAGIDAATLARTGAVDAQLAPAWLDKMTPCGAADVAPAEALAIANAGKVNAKGNCDFENGVSCHYHLGVEFVASGAERPARGEVHCIFPNAADGKSPEVFGGHFTCKGADPAAKVEAHGGAHAVQEGAACGGGLLPALRAALSSCQGVSCCDDGTLTATLEARTAGGTLDVRPDFHICAQPMELDCSALSTMTGHSANAPAFGAPIENGFAITAAAADAHGHGEAGHGAPGHTH